MDNTQLVLIAAVAVAASGLTGGACFWWYRRKLSQLGRQFEKAKLAAAQAAKLSRRHIRQLEKELAERPFPAAVPSAPSAGHPATEADQAAERRAELERSLDEAPRRPPTGFADTEPMR